MPFFVYEEVATRLMEDGVGSTYRHIGGTWYSYATWSDLVSDGQMDQGFSTRYQVLFIIYTDTSLKYYGMIHTWRYLSGFLAHASTIFGVLCVPNERCDRHVYDYDRSLYNIIKEVRSDLSFC